MKKCFKIFGWTLFSLLMVVIIAVAIACYVLITPAHLTPIVKKVVGNYVTCEYDIASVDLTVFSTFPRVEVRIDSLVLINPMEGTQNDTVLFAPTVTASLDIKQLLFDNKLLIDEAVMEDAMVNYYVAQDGTSNIDIFVSSPDTLPEEPDTTAFSLPFEDIRINRLCIQTRTLTYKDAQIGATYAEMNDATLDASVADWNTMYLHLNTPDLFACLSDEAYANHVPFAFESPLHVQLDSLHFGVDSARLLYDGYQLTLDGNIALGDTMQIDAFMRTSEWQIQPLLAYLPASLTEDLQPMHLDGSMQLNADIQGELTDTSLPQVTADIHLRNGQGDCDPLPYSLRNVRLDAHSQLDLNQLDKSKVTIRTFAADTKKSHVQGSGTVTGLSENMLLDLALRINASLPDFAYFIPDSMNLRGMVSGDTKVKIRLNDLTQMNLEKGTIQANLDLKDLYYRMDSMQIHLPHSLANVQIPNPQIHPKSPSSSWARVDLFTDTLDFKNGQTMHTLADKAKIHLETANVLQGISDCYITLQTDTLDAHMEDIRANMGKPDVEMLLSAGKHAFIRLNSHRTAAQMGEQLQTRMDTFHLTIGSRYDENGKEWLLKWNPLFSIRMKNGELRVPERLPEAIYVPSMNFVYSNRKMTIKDSEMHLGNSDLHIKGDIERIGGWLKHETPLVGTLDVTSTYWDVLQLMQWAGEQPRTTDTVQQNTQAAPKDTMPKKNFFVPKDVDFALNAHVDSVNFAGHMMKKVQGGLFIRNEALVLQEVGFICDAAKMQLTAEYKSPRPNHFYVGMDYHMVDVNIDSLISLIPQVVEIEPALKAFRGNADFHFALETYTDSLYQPKKSTIRGAASITAQNLTIIDSTTFNTLRKLLFFKKSTENRLDSINAEMTIYKSEATLFPLCVQLDKYKVAIGGYHTLDHYMDYDINLLKPLYFGLKVIGPKEDVKFKPTKCKFKKDFQPTWYNKADEEGLELRKRILQSMEKNVTIK